MTSEWPAVIRGVLFDFDGTLTRPGSIDFPGIRRALGCPPSEPVLEFIEALSTPEKRREAFRVLDDYELRAAAVSEPNPGAGDLIRHLRARSVLLGIISRNSRESILRALEKFTDVRPEDFEVIICRDSARPKPDPDGILVAARAMGLEPREVITVGDYVFDIEAARRAGSASVFLTNGATSGDPPGAADHIITRLAELRDILELLIPLPEGKLPNHLLARFLGENPLDDPSLLVPPGIGEDVAAVAIGAEENVVVLKSDPITFTVGRLGYSTVVVNANDLATSGAVPRWLLTTLLFPVGASAAQIHAIMRELQQTSREFGLTLCGGHTEVTGAVKQPVAVGHLVGTTSRDRLIDKRRMQRGDRILLTKGVAVEGTSILARDFSEELQAAGMSHREVESCQRLFLDPGISVLTEARLAAETGGVTAMHDVTEGGLATALEELSAAGRRRIRVFLDRIPVFPETRSLCDRLDIDPLGLLGSGCLLISCRRDASTGLEDALRRANVAVAWIGEALGEGTGIEARRDADATPVDWPRFEVDEIVAAIRRLTGGSHRDGSPGARAEGQR